MRPRAHRQQLDSAFEHLAWIRFEGNLFFGNAPAIAIRLQDELAPAESLVLDFTHLRYIDDTAADCIERLLKQRLPRTNAVAVVAEYQQIRERMHLVAPRQLSQRCQCHRRKQEECACT